MGNSQVLKNRCSAIISAVLATTSLFLTIGSAATCSFVNVFTRNNAYGDFYYSTPMSGGNIKIPDQFHLGLFCTAKQISNGDTMSTIAQIFVVVALFMSAFISIIFWSIAIFMKVSNCTWKLLSMSTAIIAFLHVPTFLILDGKTCKEYDCHLSDGAYSLICAIICMVFVTVITQLCDVPNWIQMRDAWKVNQRNFDLDYADGNSRGSGDDYYHILSILNTGRKNAINPVSFFRSIFYAGPPRHIAMTDESPDHDDNDDGFPHGYPRIEDTSPPDDYMRVQSFDNMMKMNASFYAACDNSRLLLHVTPSGRQIGDDDRQSEWSFANSLEEDIRIAEMEKGLAITDSDHRMHSKSGGSVSGQNDQISVSSRASVSSKQVKSVIPLQFSPLAEDLSSIVTPFDSQVIIDDVNLKSDHLDEQSLLDRDILVKGVGGPDILSPLHFSSRVIGSIFSSSLQTASLLFGLKKPSVLDDKDTAAASYPQHLDASTLNMDSAELATSKILPVPPELPNTLSLLADNDRPSDEQVRKTLSSWETFEDVNEFQKAIDAGENAANITNQTEEDCTVSTCTPDNDSDILDVSDTRDNLEDNQNIIIGVQQLNKAHRKESKKKKKKRNLSKNRSSSSVCSKHSLLDLTIDEETQDDLQLEDISGDENRSARSGVRFKSTASLSSLDAYERGYLSRNVSSHEDTLTAGLRLVTSVLSKMKEVSQKESYESIKDKEEIVTEKEPMDYRKTVEVSYAVQFPIRSTPSNYGSDEGSL